MCKILHQVVFRSLVSAFNQYSSILLHILLSCLYDSPLCPNSIIIILGLALSKVGEPLALVILAGDNGGSLER